MDGPILHLTGSGGSALPAGSYAIRVTTEAGASAVTCPVTDSATRTTCTGDSSALKATGTGTLEIVVLGEPKTMRVYVSRDGTEIAARSFTATYEDRETNGGGCGTCRFVSVTPNPTTEL